MQHSSPPRQYTAEGGRPNLSKPPMTGDVSNSVRSLLLATKDLQDVLKQWSLGEATETQVSDVYVRIGTDFNTTVHAFAHHDIDLSEIHAFPKDLRNVLEPCLGEDPSPDVLASYMPQVRQVLFKLLQCLQSKQPAWRAAASSQNERPPEY